MLNPATESLSEVPAQYKPVRRWTTTPVCPKGHNLSNPLSFVRNKRGVRRCVRCFATRMTQRHAVKRMSKTSENRYRAAAQFAATRASVFATSQAARCAVPLLAVVLQVMKGG